MFAQYQEVRNATVKGDSKAFFQTEKGKRMTTAQVRTLVKKNLSKVSTLKKTFTTRSSPYVCHGNAQS